MDMQGNYLENQTLQPDILVYNEPAASLKGEDAQLKAAVDHRACHRGAYQFTNT